MAPGAAPAVAPHPGDAPTLLSSPSGAVERQSRKGPPAAAATADSADPEACTESPIAYRSCGLADGVPPKSGGSAWSRGSSAYVLKAATTAARVLRLSGSSLDSETRAAVTFADPTLLRGISASKVLRRKGSVLRDNSGSETTYAMSRIVEQIDVFISHNWSTPQSVKFRVLAFSFNLLWCLSLNLVIGLIFMTLQAFGVLPTLDMTYDNGAQYKSSPWNVLVGTGFFFVTIFHWHDLRAFLGIPGPTLFLDKTCIDQVDEQRKRRGIQSLAAFVRHSKKMLVIYSDTYLHKLWTVYELACFMTLQPTYRLRVVPVILADVMVMGINLFLIIIVMDLISDMNAVHSALGIESFGAASYVATSALVLPACIMFCRIWRKWLHELSRIHEQATSFSVFKAACFNEEDRPLLHRSIAKFMKGIDAVPKDASEATALEAFDKKVHLEVPWALQASLGRVGIRYRHACVIFLPFFLYLMDGIGLALNQAVPARNILLQLVGGFTSYLAVYPALLALIATFMRVSLWLQRCASIWASYVATAVIITVVALSWHVVEGILRVWAEHSTAGICAFLSTSAAIFLLTAFMYRPLI